MTFFAGGKWKASGSVAAGLADGDGKSLYSASVTLPKAGKWRLRAYHADASHAATWSKGFAVVTVR